MTSITDSAHPTQPGGLDALTRLDAIARHRATLAGLDAAEQFGHVFSQEQMRRIADAAIDTYLHVQRPGTSVDLLWAVQAARRNHV